MNSPAGAACGMPPKPKANEEHFYVSRSELIHMVEEVLKARGLA
jgi:hypothetical protein